MLPFGQVEGGKTHRRGEDGKGLCGQARFDVTCNLGETSCGHCKRIEKARA